MLVGMDLQYMPLAGKGIALRFRELWLRIPGIDRTVFRSKTGRHSDMKPDAIPINNRTV